MSEIELGRVNGDPYCTSEDIDPAYDRYRNGTFTRRCGHLAFAVTSLLERTASATGIAAQAQSGPALLLLLSFD